MNKLFITGTGTGVGKTQIAMALAYAGSHRYWKPVQTGSLEDCDTTSVRQGAGVAAAPHEPAWRFALPAAPDQAALAENRLAPSVAELLQKMDALEAQGLPWAIEGAGGLMVPLNEKAETWLDFLQQSHLPVLVVAASGLGTLNHSVLTIRMLEMAGITPIGLVLSGPEHRANQESLARLLPRLRLHIFPEIDAQNDPQAFAQAAQALASFVQKTIIEANGWQAEDWQALDRAYVWHPYTQHQTAPAPLAIVGAHGAFLETAEGEHLIDASSSWWVNTIGHGRPEIARAIAAQQQRLDHVLFAGATHAPAAQLAQKVLSLAGPPFEKGRVFYSDNGSTAVEVALKIAYQEHAQKGQPQRRRFIAFEGSYHGDTFGAMAVARAEGFHGIFAPLFFESHCLPLDLAQVSACLAQEGTEIAAVIIEPLLQGAGGMKIHSPAFLQGLAALTQQYGIPLILDEVFTGLGRLGANFAFQRAGVIPDLLCVAKGLTGGNLPLAMTLATQRAFEAFLDEDKSKALLHGHSYTANPIACAAALAALDIFVSEDLAGRARIFEAHYQTWIAEHTALGLRNPRAIGGVLAFEWPGSGEGDYFYRGMQAVPVVARRHGLFLRTLGNTVYFMPPLATDDITLKKGLHALSQTLRTLIQIPHG